MVDVSMNTEAKVFGVPAAPTVEVEDRVKPQVAPVQEGSESVKGELDEKALHGRNAEKQAEAKELSEEDATKYVEEIQERLESMGTRLNLALHKDPESIIVQVTDRESGELIRQFPSEELLALRKKLADLVGLLFDTEA